MPEICGIIRPSLRGPIWDRHMRRKERGWMGLEMAGSANYTAGHRVPPYREWERVRIRRRGFQIEGKFCAGGQGRPPLQGWYGFA